MEKICVLGAGSWGTTLANILAEKGFDISLWVREEELYQIILKTRENAFFLPGIKLAQNIMPTNSIEEAVKNRAVVLCVIPSHGVRDIFVQASKFLSKDAIIVNASKGIEQETLLTVSQILMRILPKSFHKNLSVLSGPTFAKEVSRKLPTAICVAANKKAVAEKVQQVFNTNYFRVYTNSDMIGVEISGALKNVIAIAAGISDGLSLGMNARAALITRGLAEISRLGVSMGADAATFAGLSGLGDLVLTCTGELSRNRSVGMLIGKGCKLNDILSEMKMVAEGVKTAKAAYELAKKYEVEMPITEQVYYVLYKNKSPKDAVMDLMTRRLKGE
ncbi:MAG TPA: NAD(P)H-dependent glycerol-3-phosphate dehydrogenase [Thermodesulfobacteriota bacterium]|nr:NAD(P)H-dependent glycerol-3-phosphate dehydrogenase [Thermodesulfobacteriota bacterium]